MDRRIEENLGGRTANYILPLFWQRGEADEIITEEIEKIYESGIRAFCVESRPHEDFCGPDWWRTMDHIISQCKMRQMQVWIFDDKHFPTGYANGKIPEKYPHLRKWQLGEKHMDVRGPQKDCTILISPCVLEKYEETIVSVTACRRSGVEEELTGETIDLTGQVQGDFVYLDVPEGVWRIFVMVKTRNGSEGRAAESIDMMNKESVEVMIKEIYEPHYEHYQEEFGKTIAGFFTDEPNFGNMPTAGFHTTVGSIGAFMPWNDEVAGLLEERTGLPGGQVLPALWFPFGEKTKEVRVAYMDLVTEAYSRNFCFTLGDWCRAHGVAYIGHVVEDMNINTRLGRSTGHYFRSLAGQDMSGIDVVYQQIMPDYGDYSHAIFASSRKSDPEFYHFALAKLGASMAHLQPNKKGRAMCEIFGAFGWAEGLPTMKWLTDHMLVRGINWFVPHAFSAQYPDSDCPPHFYARGRNPQFGGFRHLMDYMNRVSHIFNDGIHRSSAALMYHAEAEWSGGAYMYEQKPAKVLAESQIDFDIVPYDCLMKAAIAVDGKLEINQEQFPVIIVPYSQYLPSEYVAKLQYFASCGVSVIYVDWMPEETEASEGITVVKLEELSRYMRAHGLYDVSLDREYKDLRIYHYQRQQEDLYMFNNESIRESFCGTITLKNRGEYVIYDAMKNRLTKAETAADGSMVVTIEPYENLIIGFGMDMDQVEKEEKRQVEYSELNLLYEIAVRPVMSGDQFEVYRTDSPLINITGKDNLPEFSGVIRYTTQFQWEEHHCSCILDLGYVGETAKVTVNGQEIGEAICPPYRFVLEEDLLKEFNTLVIETANNPVFREKDRYSRFIPIKPSGVMGPVRLGLQKSIS